MYPNYNVFKIADGPKAFGKDILTECLQIRNEIINDPVTRDIWSAANENGYPYRIIGSENVGIFTYSIHRTTNDELMRCMEEFFEKHGEITDIVIARTIGIALTDGRTIAVITEDGDVHQLIHVSITEYTIKVKDKEGHEKDMYFVDYYFTKLDEERSDEADADGLTINISRHGASVDKEDLVLGEETDYLLDFDPQPVEYDMSLVERIHMPSSYTTDYVQDEAIAEEMGISSSHVDIAFSAPDACLLFLANSDFKAPAKATVH